MNLSPWAIVGVVLAFTHITIASITIFLHRHQAHGSVSLHPLVSHFFRFWLWMTTGMVTREWVAVHRKHHARCETEDDPHSPQVKGINTVLWRGTELYRKEASNEQTMKQYGQGTPDDWLENKVYARHPGLGLTLMAIIDLLCFGVLGVTVFAIQMLWTPLWAAGVINGIGHYWGYRNFETSDAARNIVPIGIFIGGEELHNNHHAYATSARLSNKWWEFDIGYFYIRLMQLFGLAKVKKIAPIIRMLPEKPRIDIETVKAVVRNRVHVMALYGNSVIRPVIEQECKTASSYLQRLFRKSKKLMIREDIALDHTAENTLEEVFNNSTTLETVYQFKQKLKEIWARGHANYEIRVASLQEWCHQAEMTGIQVLQEFARAIRGYSLQMA